MEKKIRVMVWNEFRHEKSEVAIRKVYPAGMHAVIASHLNKQAGITARTAVLDQPEHGLTPKVLANTDVLTWWGHLAHNEVSDEIVSRVQERVLEGMGLVVLHSGHHSKIFKRLMGTTCNLRWREAAEKERLWNVEPGHPVTEGIGDYFELPHEEMYGERFDVPTPDKLVFISWFAGGEVFRSGCCYERGHGRIFYFRPGHETYPTYYDANVMRVITNATRWAAPRIKQKIECPNTQPIEKLGR